MSKKTPPVISVLSPELSQWTTVTRCTPRTIILMGIPVFWVDTTTNRLYYAYTWPWYHVESIVRYDHHRFYVHCGTTSDHSRHGAATFIDLPVLYSECTCINVSTLTWSSVIVTISLQQRRTKLYTILFQHLTPLFVQENEHSYGGEDVTDCLTVTIIYCFITS